MQAPSRTRQVDSGDSEEESGHSKPLEAPHYVGKWQRYCTHGSCAGANPDFKDETKCQGDGCGMHLGSLEVAKELARCPNCGGTKLGMVKA